MGKGALEGERQMTKMVPALSVQRGASGWPGADGWHGSDLNDLLMYESYIDTSGYALDDLTELAHVELPTIVHQEVHRLRRVRFLDGAAIEHGCEMVHQGRDVPSALAQCRQVHVLAEPSE